MYNSSKWPGTAEKPENRPFGEVKSEKTAKNGVSGGFRNIFALLCFSRSVS
jgi:hypothetical protein